MAKIKVYDGTEWVELLKSSDISAWAKASSKPSYTWNEITGKPSFATVATSGSYDDLSNKPSIPTVYLKDASVNGNTLTITKQDNTTVTYNPITEIMTAFDEDVMEAFFDDNYPSFIKLVDDGNGNPRFAFDKTSYLPLSGGTITGDVVIRRDTTAKLSVKGGTNYQGDGEVTLQTVVNSGGSDGEILIVDRMGTQTKIRTAGIFPNGLNNKLIFPSISSDETLATQEWVSSSLTLDNVSDGTTRKLNQVTASTGKAKLGVKTVGVKPKIAGQGYLELSDSSVVHGTTTYYRDSINYGGKIINLPTSAGTLALTSNIKHLYKHWVIFNVYSDISFKFEFYSTSTTSSSTLTAANLLQMLQGKIVGAVNNNSGMSVMLSVHQAIQANTYQGFIYYVGGSYVEFYPFAVNATYVTIEDSGYEEV